MVYATSFARAQRMCTALALTLLPPRCVACGAACQEHGPVMHRPLDLCPGCLQQLPFNHQSCQICALPLTGTEGLVCGACLRRPPHFQQAVCTFRYEYPLAQLVRSLKYGGRLAVARVVADLMAEHLQTQLSDNAPPDCLVPVPLHAMRFCHRGYNQVIEVGRLLSRRLNVPLRTDVVERTRATLEQAGQSRRKRRLNVRGAFRVCMESPPARIALLDDVITTGSTVNELARVLTRAGVEHVQVWGIARANRSRHTSRQNT